MRDTSGFKMHHHDPLQYVLFNLLTLSVPHCNVIMQQPPSVPATPARHYEPPPQVIMQNESFEYALRVAPNVLYSRFKQYGQVSSCYLEITSGS